MAVHYLKTKSEWNSFHSQHKDKAIFVDFTATWCGPCRMIGPKYDEFAEVYSSLLFTKVDVDENEEVAADCGISAMPTFQVWRNGEKIDELVGASVQKLEELIKRHA